MAVQGQQTGNNQTVAGEAYTGGGTTQQVNQNQGNAGSVPGTLSPRVAFGRNRAPINRDAASEITNHMIRAFKDYIEENDDFRRLGIRLIPIPRESGIAAASLAVAIAGEIGNETVYAYHTLLLAEDSGQLREQFENADNQSYLIPKAPTDILDETFIRNVAAIVEKEFPQSKVFYADAEVVPVGFNYKDTQAIRNLLANAVEADYGEIASRQPNFTYLSLKEVANTSGLSVRTHYNQQEVIDSVGQPVRADIQIDFRVEPINTGNMNTENIEQTETFSVVSGYIDQVYDPVNPVVNPWMTGLQQRNANESQLFSAQFVVTNIQADGMGGDLSASLLALYTTFPMAADTQPWLQNFLPQHLVQQRSNSRSGGFDPKDVGALNWEFGLMVPGETTVKPFPTGPEVFSAADYYAWMNMTFRKGISIALDVEEAGGSTWFTRAFSACRVIDSPAHKAIVAAADGLTGGRFSELFNKTSRNIITGHENRIILGTYKDQSGIAHDLRTVDLLYMLNKEGHINPAIGRLFGNTFNNDNPSFNVNLARRLKFIEGAVSDVKVTGFARREVLHGDFVTCLDQAISSTNLRIRQTYDSGSNRIEHRASGNLHGSGALIGGLNSQTFTSGTTGGNQGGAYRPMFGGGRTYY